MSSTIPEVIDEANTLFAALTEDLNIDLELPPLVINTAFAIPEWDDDALEICPLTVADLTTGVVGGSGVFDEMMKALSAHLQDQFEKNRITGADYSKVYLGSVQAAMQHGIAFLLGKDRAYLENLALKEALRTAEIRRTQAEAELEQVRVNLQIAQYTALKVELDAYTAQNQYALSKLALVTGYNEVNLKQNQTLLVGEQYESQRGQARDTLSTGGAIAGLIGAQRELYVKQAWAFERDSEVKFIKMIMDTWTARKTIDEGVAVPEEIDTDKIDELVDQARTKLDFTG